MQIRPIPFPFVAGAALATLWVACFWVFGHKAFEIATTDPDWSHLLGIPLVASWWVYSLRGTLRVAPAKPDWRGFPVLLLGLFAYAAALFPIRNGMLEGGSMLLALAGLVLLLGGNRWLRILLPVVMFLGFTIRVSDRAWELITAKLQTVAAGGASGTLDVLGLVLPGDVETQLNGNTITLLQQTASGMRAYPLNVAEACSGIRSLMAFVALGFVMAWMPAGRLWWQRVGMTLLAVPVALAVNIGRVTVLGLLTLVNPELVKGDFHILVGLLMLLPAGGLLLASAWVMEKLVIHVDDGAKAPFPPPKAAPADAPTGGRPRTAVWRGAALGAGLAGAGTGLWLTGLKLPALAGLSTLAAVACTLSALALLAVAAVPLIRRLAKNLPHLPLATGLALGCLGAGLAGQHAVIIATRTVLIKEPLPLRRDLHTLAQTLGSWKMTREEPPESAEVERALGTREYLTRWYENGTGQSVRLHLAYYTGGVDTVPHVPDRCFVAAGAKPLEVAEIPLQIGSKRLNATLFRYAKNQGGESSVIYFFSANGKFLASPNAVRLQGFDLADRCGYHCKMEVEFQGVGSSAKAVVAAGDFLATALPLVMECLPSWPPPKTP